MPFGLAADLSVGSVREPKSCAPPSWFRGVEGVRSAWPSACGPFGRTPARLKGSAAQRAGIRYERKAMAFLKEAFGKDFRPSPWFKYEDFDGNLRWCQPDGIVVTDKMVVIWEIKVNFSSDAWWQLRKLYEPVIREAYHPPQIALAILCKSFDPAVPFPEKPCALPAPQALLCGGWDRTAIGVLQWRK